ncbi:MAG TPA: hypothetical protein VFQ39_13695 [Longimicrobium sp.]|nr:hypothetical protein [Longimicrobium sp.]
MPVQISRWGAVGIVAVIAIGVFVAMGYGVIGVFLLFILGCLLGGALMSYVSSD